MIANPPGRATVRAATDVALIVTFLVAISLPLVARLGGLDTSLPLTEKRMPATLPDLPRAWSSLADFSDRFEAYWNDAFGFRSALVRLHGRTMLALGTSPSDKVVVGSDGWLFYAERGALTYYRATEPFTPADLERWRDALEARRDWLRDRHIHYLFVVAPNKETIYPERMPRRIRRLAAPSRLDQLLTHLRTHADVEVLDVRGALWAAKDDLLYRRTDSHWNDRGAFTAYRTIVERLTRWFPTLQSPPLSAFDVKTFPHPGDLADMLGLSALLVEDWLTLTPRESRRAREDRTSRKRGWTSATAIDDGTLPRAVMLHDSFATNLIPFLSEHFSRIAYAWQLEFAPDLITRERPDVVIQEIVERSLIGPPPFDSTLRQYARWRARFNQSPDVRLRIEPGGPALEARADVAVLPATTANGALLLRPTGPNPSILLPSFTVARDTVPLLRIDLMTPIDSRLDVYYETTRARGYDWARRFAAPLAHGRSIVFVPMLEPNLVGRLRLDLGATGRDIVLHALEVRAVPR